MRLIDADALMRCVPTEEIASRMAVANAPTIEERKTGKWIDMGDFEQCSVCLGTRSKEVQTFYGKAIWMKTDFCPNCGADMRGRENDKC